MCVDVVFVNSMEFIVEKGVPQIGQLILSNILSEKYTVEWLNFDGLNYYGKLKYEESYSESIEKYAEFILAKNPRIVGFYTICSSFISAVRLANAIKKRQSGVKIVFGGPHATILAKECLEELPFVDAVILGESEKTIELIVERLINNEALKGLQGVAYRNERKVIVAEYKELVKNDELSKYTVYDYSPYQIQQGDLVMIEAGRGCPYACTFCSTSTFWGRKFRIKPAQDIIEEMCKFNALYGVTRFSMLHDLFTANKQYVKDFCKMYLDKKLNFTWDCSSRIDVLDEETIDLLAEAKCTGLFIGLETGSPRMQKLINKNLDIEKALKLIKYLVDKKFNLTIAFIYGYPEETQEDFVLTVNLMERLRKMGVNEIQLGTYIPLPNTLEVTKVKDSLYFEEEDINFSIYKKYVFDDVTKTLINNYSELFVQYYSFESTIRVKYRYFDLFHAMFFAVSKIFFCCSNFILNKYTYIELYEKYLDKIETHIKKSRKGLKEASFFLEESCQFFSCNIFQEELRRGNEFFEVAYSIEKVFYKYCMSKTTECETYRMAVDYIHMRKYNEIIRKEVQIVFDKELGHPRIMQMGCEKK